MDLETSGMNVVMAIIARQIFTVALSAQMALIARGIEVSQTQRFQ
jgi:hypothetical protein